MKISRIKCSERKLLLLCKFKLLQMTVKFLTEYNTRCYGVTFQNIERTNVQKFEDSSNQGNNIFCVKSLQIFLGKSKVCDMTVTSEAFDKSVFHGKTILLKISEENDNHRYVYVGGDMICSILTNDNIYKNISNMGTDLTP